MAYNGRRIGEVDWKESLFHSSGLGKQICACLPQAGVELLTYLIGEVALAPTQSGLMP